jgi:hypothetical protein
MTTPADQLLQISVCEGAARQLPQHDLHVVACDQPCSSKCRL